MDLTETMKVAAQASDRVLLILVVALGVRWLAARDEKKGAQMLILYQQADERIQEMSKLVATCTEVLRQVMKKLE